MCLNVDPGALMKVGCIVAKMLRNHQPKKVVLLLFRFIHIPTQSADKNVNVPDDPQHEPGLFTQKSRKWLTWER
jgi:hypothetical protein